jgi:hypothetical protein
VLYCDDYYVWGGTSWWTSVIKNLKMIY